MSKHLLDLLRSCEGFEWDKGNQPKIWQKHRVSKEEVEQVFFDPNVRVFADRAHSEQETRLIVLGKTHAGRLLFIACTIRHKKIRVISARDAKKEKEVGLYEKAA